MRYGLRISLLDRPGMLGSLATALGHAGVDIVSLEVIERVDGITVDDLTVETAMDTAALRMVCERLPGIVVEGVNRVTDPAGQLSATALAAMLVECPGRSFTELVGGLPRALNAHWAAAVTDTSAGAEVLAACANAPEVPAGLRLPFLPLTKPRRFPPAQWMPAAWRSAGEHLEVAAVPLRRPVSSVLLARVNGPRFRAGDLQRLSDLARVAVAADARVLRLPAAV